MQPASRLAITGRSTRDRPGERKGTWRFMRCLGSTADTNATAGTAPLNFGGGTTAPHGFLANNRFIPARRPPQWARPKNPPSGNAGQ